VEGTPLNAQAGGASGHATVAPGRLLKGATGLVVRRDAQSSETQQHVSRPSESLMDWPSCGPSAATHSAMEAHTPNGIARADTGLL